MAASAVLYAAFCAAFGRDVVVTDGGPTTVMLSALMAVPEAESVTCTVKLIVPVAVGVPEITPVAELRVSPAGKLSTVMDQLYDGVPPVAASAVL